MVAMSLIVGVLVYMALQTHDLQAQEVLPANAINIQRGTINTTIQQDPMFSMYTQGKTSIQPASGSYIYGEVPGPQGRTVVNGYSYQYNSAEEAVQAVSEFQALAKSGNFAELQVETTTQQEGSQEASVTSIGFVGTEGDIIRWRITQQNNQLRVLLINGFDKGEVERLMSEQSK
jgi:hypothetical protein